MAKSKKSSRKQKTQPKVSTTEPVQTAPALEALAPVEPAPVAPTPAPSRPPKVEVPQTPQGAARSAGIQDYILAGRPKPHDFETVYGPTGRRMTWIHRAACGADAAHFQEALTKCKEAGTALYAPVKAKAAKEAKATAPAQSPAERLAELRQQMSSQEKQVAATPTAGAKPATGISVVK